MNITRSDIEQWTRERGEGWAYSHVQRVIALGQQIAGDLPVNMDWFWYAAFLHDWGAFPCYRQPGGDHALRSAEVVRDEILAGLDLPAKGVAAVLEAIERHDYRDTRPTNCPEALLLREADFLDFLGPVGVAREFAWGPNDLQKVIKRIHGRMDGIRGRFILPAAQVLAETRLAEMENLLARLEQDSFGFL